MREGESSLLGPLKNICICHSQSVPQAVPGAWLGCVPICSPLETQTFGEMRRIPPN